jgi:MFS family permease
VASIRLSERLGDRRLFRSAPLVMAVGVIGLGLLPNLGGLFVFGLAGFSVAAARPVVEARMLAEIPGSVRATILSVDSLILRLLYATMSPFGGLVADAAGLPIAFVVMGAVALGVLLAVLSLTTHLPMWYHVTRLTQDKESEHIQQEQY